MELSEYMTLPPEELKKYVLIHGQKVEDILSDSGERNTYDMLICSKALEKQADLLLSLGSRLAAQLEPNQAAEALSDAEEFYRDSLAHINELLDVISTGDSNKDLHINQVLEDVDNIEGFVEEKKDILEEFALESEKLKFMQKGELSLARGATEQAVKQIENAIDSCEKQTQLCDDDEQNLLMGWKQIALGIDNLKKRDAADAANHFSKAYAMFPEGDRDIGSYDDKFFFELAKFYHYLAQGIYYSKNTNDSLAVDEFDKAIERAKKIEDNMQHMFDNDDKELIGQDIKKSYKNLIRSLENYAYSRQIVSTGKIHLRNDEFNKAIDKFEEAKLKLENAADNISEADISVFPDYGDMMRNYARETIPELIRTAKESKRKYEELNELKNEHEKLRKEMLGIGEGTSIEIENVVEATSMAKASAKFVNQIRPVILDNVQILRDSIEDSELPDEDKEELMRKIKAVENSSEEPVGFLDKVKELGGTSSGILDKYDREINNAANLSSLLQFFSLFASEAPKFI
ncbi:hypothetical protein DU502_06000 [Haloplanus aerogenes]|nr:hypothetical protein DU502_06000 [Haloplanus aerogenes]